MSCYIHHLGEVMDMLGWEPTKENKKRLDSEISAALGMPDEPCNLVWARVKELTSNRTDLPKLLELIDPR